MTVFGLSLRNARDQLMLGVGVGLAALGGLYFYTHSGRALLIAAGLVLAITGILLLRFPVALSAMIGFLLLSNLSHYLPGASSLLFGGMLCLLLVRKLLTADPYWGATPLLLAAVVFAAWFQSSLIWTEQNFFSNWHLFYRVILAMIVLHELLQSLRDFYAFFVGAALGMIFTAISTAKTAYEFYVSGVASQLASAVSEIESSRFYGHWVDPNIMSITLVAFLGITIALWRSDAPRPIRLLMMTASLLTVMTIMISLSRAGMIGCIIVILAMMAVDRRRMLMFVSFAALLALVVAFVPIDFFGRITALVSGDASTGERTSLLLAGWELFWKEPLIGGGFGTFEQGVIYRVIYLSTRMFAHNTIVDVAVDAGVIGLALYVTCLILGAGSLDWRAWRYTTGDRWLMLNHGIRASLLATFFSLMTVTTTSYVPFWALFTIAALYGVVRKRELFSAPVSSGLATGTEALPVLKPV